MILRSAFVAATLLALAPAAHAWEHVEKGVRISDPWTPATLRLAAGNAVYLRVKNETAAALHLTAVKSPAAGSSTLHTTLYGNDGVARMLDIAQVEIAPGETLVLEPQAMHVMMSAMPKTVTKDQTFPITLSFREIGDITVDVMVEAATALAPRAR